jgi:hypothetical protein
MVQQLLEAGRTTWSGRPVHIHRFEYEAGSLVIEIAKNLIHERRSALTLSIVVASSLTLAGCGGSSGTKPLTDENPNGSGDQTKTPTLEFFAQPATLAQGGTSTLTWKATGAQGCEASAGWDGSRAVSGSQQVGPIQGDTEFRLSCSGAGGGVSGLVVLVVDDGSAASVSLRAEPEQVPVNGSTTLTWSAPGAAECTATGAWSGSQPASGSVTTEALTQSSSFGLSCTGKNGSAINTVKVEVLDRMLRWDAPTKYADGSPLSSLGGYVIYWGRQSGNYTDSHRIEDAAVTEWRADLEAGSYFFALTAFDAEGNESEYSNEVVRSIL